MKSPRLREFLSAARRRTRRAALPWLLAVMMLLGSLSGCQEALGPEDTVTQFLSRFENQDFARMYSLLATHSKKEISLNDFCDRYESIFDAIKVESITCAAGETADINESHRTVTFTMIIQSSRLDTASFDMEMTLEMEKGRWGVDWSPSLILPGMEEGDKVQLIQLPASRGEIFDASGNVLAKNDFAPTVYVNLDKVDDAEVLVRLLAPILMINETDLRKKMAALFEDEADDEPTAPADDGDSDEDSGDAPARLVALKSYTEDEMTPELEAQLTELPAVGIETNSFTPIRSYPNGQLLSHVLGYTGPVTAEDLEANPDMVIPTDGLVGKAGLEKSYNDQLTGIPGWELVIVDENGIRKQSMAKREAKDGLDLRLSIDITLQRQAEMQLMEYLTDEMAGTVVVLDPDTGFIQAIASYPAFDPNAFTLGISTTLWNQYNDPENNLPLFDRATQGLYPPGSTMKPFTAGIALMTNTVGTDYVFQGTIENNLWTPDIAGWVYPAIKRFSATTPPINMRNAMINSDNIYFADIAMKIGAKTFYEYCQRLGMDQAVPSDLPIAAPQISNTGEFVTIKDLADSGYGQGQVLITPLQMASLFASLANGGTVYSPRVVDSVCETQGHEYVTVDEIQPTAWIRNDLDSDALDILNPYLRLVVSEGTAKKINVEGLDVHGKTGTAQIGDEKAREIAWIIGYTGEICESTGTRRLVCVTLEVPANGGDNRGYIAKALLED